MTKKSFILLLVLSLAFAACGGAEEETVEEPAVVEEAETLDAPATTVAETLDKITFGFIPSAEQADLQDNIKPLMKVLTDGLGIEVEGFVTSDFSGLLVAMGSGQADIGAFNTLGYVNALNVFPTRIEAIAKVVRYGSGSYHANFWTTDASVCDSPPVIGAFENIDGVPQLILGSETESPDVKALQVGWTFGDNGKIPEVRNIDGVDVTVSPGYACEADLNVLRGEKVLFVEEGSTSGYLYPSLQLKNMGIDYQNDITQVFAGSHDGNLSTNSTDELAVLLVLGDGEVSWDDVLITISIDNGTDYECANPGQSSTGYSCKLHWDGTNNTIIKGYNITILESDFDLCNGECWLSYDITVLNSNRSSGGATSIQ